LHKPSLKQLVFNHCSPFCVQNPSGNLFTFLVLVYAYMFLHSVCMYSACLGRISVTALHTVHASAHIQTLTHTW